MSKVESSTISKSRSVPAARIQFLAEDRQWIADRIQDVLESGQLTLGKYGAEFEKQFAASGGFRYAVSVNSGTSALEVILRSLDVEGKEVLVPANTFFATAAAVLHAGATPILLDMEPDYFSIRPADVERAITPDTAGVIVVHIGGIVSSHVPALKALALRRNIWLIEDAAHAHGSSLHGVSAGGFGSAGAFSFYPTKVMTCAEGGMIVTGDQRLHDEARTFRDQGKASFSQNSHTRLGYNWRMSEPHAIIGLKHLQRLPQMIADRQRMAALYDQELSSFKNLQPLRPPEGAICNYYKYIAVLTEKVNRNSLKSLLKDRYGVSLAGEVYEEPLHKQPVFEGLAAGPFPIAEDLCARHICLPVYSGMDEDEARQVIRALREVIG